MDAQIRSKADFDHIRYAQLWEDADVLVKALGDQQGKTLVSICSAGDNALAMLTLNPNKIVTLDLSPAQIACLEIRISAYRTLTHAEFLVLIGAREGGDRGALLDRVVAQLDPHTAQFWQEKRDDVSRYGLGGVGKFERYFRIFRTRLLPMAQSKATLRDLFVPKPKGERQTLFDTRWNNWRWRLLLKVFFSNRVMGYLGRDPAFFDHVDGSLADHVASRLSHAGVDLQPAENPYMHYILHGIQGDSLPLAWREENFDIIRSRLDRLEVHCGSLESFVSSGEKADGFNLSDIFEYMDETVFKTVYASIIKASNPAARLVYWNMMVPRRVPPEHASSVVTLDAEEAEGKRNDKAFFYSDFVVEQVR